MRGNATFYNEEVDGILLDRVKFFWGADYGHLSFTSDHSLVQNCEGFGASAAVYRARLPRPAPSRPTSIRTPRAPTPSSGLRPPRLCARLLGLDGERGPHHRNHIYGNMTGISSDTLSAAGHPGFPADSSEIDHNYIYANNLDLYTDQPPVPPLVAVPIGTGIIYAGMNDARVHHNWIFDNWRDGAMLFAVPDSLTNGGGAEGDIFPGIVPGCAASGLSTSCGNRFFRNSVGRAPRGLPLPGCDRHVRQRPHTGARPRKPNGNDFLVGRVVPGQHRELLVPEHRPRRDRGQRERSGRCRASPGTRLRCCRRTAPPASATTTWPSSPYLIDCGNGPDEGAGPGTATGGHGRPGAMEAPPHGARILSRAAAAPSVREVARGGCAEEAARRTDASRRVSRTGLTVLVLAAAAVALPFAEGRTTTAPPAVTGTPRWTSGAWA